LPLPFSKKIFLFALAAFFTTLAVSSTMVAGHLGSTVTCYSLTQPVTVDGKWTTKSEWNDTAETQLLVADGTAVGYFRVKHDATWLYILAESLIDTSLDYDSANDASDYMGVFLDTVHNDGKSPASDDYRFVASWINASYTRVTTRKGDGAGWSETSPVEGVQAKIALDTDNSPHPPYPHVAGEFKIPLSIIAIGTFGFFIRFGDYSVILGTPGSLTKAFYWPGPSLADQSIDPSAWGNVSYSREPIPEFSSTWLIIATSVLAVIVIFRLSKKTTTFHSVKY